MKHETMLDLGGPKSNEGCPFKEDTEKVAM